MSQEHYCIGQKKNNNGNECYYLEDRMYAVADGDMVIILTADSYDEAKRKAKARYEKPQGEWKETEYETGALGITYRQTQCSNCGWEHALPMWWHFCPNCGAAMKKEAENATKEAKANKD